MDVTWMEIPRQAPRKCRRNCLPLDGRFPVAHVGIGSSPGKQCAQAIETTLRAVPPRAPEGREMKQPWSHGDRQLEIVDQGGWATRAPARTAGSNPWRTPAPTAANS